LSDSGPEGLDLRGVYIIDDKRIWLYWIRMRWITLKAYLIAAGKRVSLNSHWKEENEDRRKWCLK